ncbi:MAG: ATP-binding cassette domain-containing protein [Candidatus Borkfalkiaceae bacterium]|mgnify:FL=1|nr:ATP-binding cassette domain-containing protein [Christensenellaceae bacterium]
MIELINVKKSFGDGTDRKTVLNGVNLKLEKGDFVTVIGGNGAGKSTLLNAIGGSIFVDEGKIIIGGKDITRTPEHKRAAFLGRVFQDPLNGTAADMQIIENLALAKRRGKRKTLRWCIGKNETEEYKALLKEFDLGLDERLTQKVGTLSGGQRQAITLLMASLSSPELLLLDEHTAALDPKTAEKVLRLTNEIIARENLTALMITHNMTDALKCGNRLIMMDGGRVVYDVRGEEKLKLTVNDLIEKFGNFA